MAKSDGAVMDPEATQAEGATSKRGRGSVTYFGKGLETMSPLDELPPQEARKRGASSQYFDMLTSVGEDENRVGKWNPVAQFSTTGGAKAIANQLNKQVAGKINAEGSEKVRGNIAPEQVRRIPEYDGWGWTFDSRTVELEDGSEGSVLYAKLSEVASA